MFDWSKHLNTKKHLKEKYVQHVFECVCSKKYKYAKTLKRHEANCIEFQENKKHNTDVEYEHNTHLETNDIVFGKETTQQQQPDYFADKIITPEFFLEIFNQNQQLIKKIYETQEKMTKQQEQMAQQHQVIMEYCKQPKNVKNNFNLNFFLNVKCKDALNISDFVKNITINIRDLEHIGRFGYVEGVSRIIVNALQQLDLYRRPIHCTDVKREVLFVKDEDKWEKDQDGVKVKKVIGEVSQKNCQTFCSVVKPEMMMAEHPDCDKNLNMMKNVNGGSEEMRGKSHDKILSIISQKVVLEPENAVV